MTKSIRTLAMAAALVGGGWAVGMAPASAEPGGCPGDKVSATPGQAHISPIAQSHQKTACSHLP